MGRSQKFKLIRIILSAVLFLFSLFIPAQGIKLGFCLAAYLISGYDILAEAAGNIVNGQIFDEKLLMSIASLGAFALGEYHEAVFVMVLFQTGELFESIAVGKSRRSVAALMDICSEYANVERGGELLQLDPAEVEPGEIILVKPGERIPLDGRVAEGRSGLNTGAITGESLPRDVGPGDEVYSGCVNLNGLLKIRVSRRFEDSTVSRIMELVEESAARKSKSENFIKAFARWYTPCVVVCALLLALLPPIFYGQWGLWIHRALTFLVISCPCALVISVPLSYFGGIGSASRRGILVKGSNYLDALARCGCCVFDKTGTLTRGSFCLAAVEAAEEGREELLLEYAALGESFSDHPIAQALKKSRGEAPDRSRLREVRESAGFGIEALADGRELLVGSARLMESRGIEYTPAKAAGTAVYTALDGLYLGCIVFADQLKDDAEEAIHGLHRLGIGSTVMLSGDRESIAQDVGRRLGIDRVHAELLPGQKAEMISRLLDREKGGTVAFIGDGINDAPSLSRADVGIAMGALGSDAAIEAADVVIMDDKLSKIPIAISISRKTRRIVIQNIAISLTVKFAALILGALGLAGMWAAAFADVGVCMIAVLNAMRTLK